MVCSFNLSKSFELAINTMIGFFTVMLTICPVPFDLEYRRKVMLILDVSKIILWEIIHAATTYALYKAICESNSEKNIFKVASDILTTFICVFTSLLCSWNDIKFSYCSYNGVSEFTIFT